MLQLRPNCECCDRDLPPEMAAMICSFECTFCPECTTEVLRGVCPNCGGDLSQRPIRPGHLLTRYPASTKRVLKVGGCAPPGNSFQADAAARQNRPSSNHEEAPWPST